MAPVAVCAGTCSDAQRFGADLHCCLPAWAGGVCPVLWGLPEVTTCPRGVCVAVFTHALWSARTGGLGSAVWAPHGAGSLPVTAPPAAVLPSASAAWVHFALLGHVSVFPSCGSPAQASSSRSILLQLLVRAGTTHCLRDREPLRFLVVCHHQRHCPVSAWPPLQNECVSRFNRSSLFHSPGCLKNWVPIVPVGGPQARVTWVPGGRGPGCSPAPQGSSCRSGAIGTCPSHGRLDRRLV